LKTVGFNRFITPLFRNPPGADYDRPTGDAFNGAWPRPGQLNTAAIRITHLL
jgi:hypothetical protein